MVGIRQNRKTAVNHTADECIESRRGHSIVFVERVENFPADGGLRSKVFVRDLSDVEVHGELVCSADSSVLDRFVGEVCAIVQDGVRLVTMRKLPELGI